MHESSPLFYKIGGAIYRRRYWIILIWIAFFLMCLPNLKDVISPFKSTGFMVDGSSSERADHFLNVQLGYGHNEFIILYHSKTLQARDPKFKRLIEQSLKGLDNIWIKHEIIYPEGEQISSDQHTAYVVILLKTTRILSSEELNLFVQAIKKPKHMSMNLGGEPIFIENINEQTQKDLFKADLLAAPVSIITLLIIFGTVIATLVPVGLGAVCAVAVLTLLYIIGHLTSLSIFTLNIALLLTLCLSLDYALFIINRFREELRTSHAPIVKIQITMATAGRAVFFSGLAVSISLSALLFFPINILFSIGIGGLLAVLVAVLAALTLLPAILAVLNHRINSLPVRRKSTYHKRGFWYIIAKNVVQNPIRYFCSTLFFVLVLAYTILQIHIGITDFQVLPKQSKNQKFFDMYTQHFHEQELNPIMLIASTQQDNIFSKKSIAHLYDFVQKIQQLPYVDEVNSIVSLDPSLSKQDYMALYQRQPSDTHIQQYLTQSTRSHFTVIKIISQYPPDAPETKILIESLQHLKHNPHLVIALTGTPVINSDVLSVIKHVFPYTAVWVLVLTYLILLILLRSLFLPFKAIFMNILSLCATYGVLVFVFQEGHFHTWLHFHPAGILDINLIIIIFCALFGFSMDYEVFLLTRIQEAYITTRDNNKSIVQGIIKSSRIITSAALIVIILCGSFMVADVLMVKEFGLGIAIAIFVDAFAIRTLLVPSTMALVKEWNWYCPKILKPPRRF